MASCLNPYILNVGIKKDKRLSFSSKLIERDPVIYSLDQHNKKPATILAPCGKCYNCRLNRARDWTIRTIHEYSSPKFNRTFMYFFTLTYDNDHIGDNNLDYRDVQLFLKKLRKYYKDDTLKFLCVGEYGFNSGRKHWHILIFGFKKLIKYRKIHDLWQYGNVDIDIVKSYSAVSYMLKYAFKDYKVSPKEYVKEGRRPPMFRCSKGFGKDYAVDNLDKFMFDGYIQYNNSKYRIPRFYRELYYKVNLIDGWKEYEKTLVNVHENILSHLKEYGFSLDLVHRFEIGSFMYYKSYLDKLRPVMLEKNKKLFDNYFKNFYEKI